MNSEREEEHGVRRGPVGHAHFSLIVKYLSIILKKKRTLQIKLKSYYLSIPVPSQFKTNCSNVLCISLQKWRNVACIILQLASPALRLLDLFVCDITFLLPGTYVLFYLFQYRQTFRSFHFSKLQIRLKCLFLTMSPQAQICIFLWGDTKVELTRSQGKHSFPQMLPDCPPK